MEIGFKYFIPTGFILFVYQIQYHLCLLTNDFAQFLFFN